MATATLNKWGNSQGVVIPKNLCNKLHIKPGDSLELSLSKSDGELILKPLKRYSLEALMAGYTGPKPKEYDWGKPVGKEMW